MNRHNNINRDTCVAHLRMPWRASRAVCNQSQAIYHTCIKSYKRAHMPHCSDVQKLCKVMNGTYKYKPYVSNESTACPPIHTQHIWSCGAEVSKLRTARWGVVCHAWKQAGIGCWFGLCTSPWLSRVKEYMFVYRYKSWGMNNKDDTCNAYMKKKRDKYEKPDIAVLSEYASAGAQHAQWIYVTIQLFKEETHFCRKANPSLKIIMHVGSNYECCLLDMYRMPSVGWNGPWCRQRNGYPVYACVTCTYMNVRASLYVYIHAKKGVHAMNAT